MNNADISDLKFAFAEAVKSARKTKGLFQREVAEKAGVEQSYLSKIERGEREPTLSVAFRICEVLGLDINDFAKRHI